jgi:hypothetical protein
MAKPIQAWGEFGPKLAKTDPVTPEEVIEQLIAATNQTRGSVLAVLSELDVVIENGLKAGRIVQLPNGTNYRPIGKKDGTVRVTTRFNPRITQQINVGFRGKWLNADNIGKSEGDVIAQWNATHPDDPIVP